MTDELPGIQDKSDLTGGQTDCDRAAQKKMRGDFEAWFATSGMTKFKETAWAAWQACAARSAETIARLEKQLAVAQSDNVAIQKVADDRFAIMQLEAKRTAEAQADNARLREVLDTLAKLGNGDKFGNSAGNQIAQEALAQTLDTSALDAYVAKKTAWQPIETAPKDSGHILICEIDADTGEILWSSHGWWVSTKHSQGWSDGDGFCWPTHWVPLPPAPDKQGEQAE